MPPSSPAPPADSTGGEKDLSPYWNDYTREISSRLWLPIETASRFGFELIQRLVERNGGAVLVLNQQDASPESELTEDIPAILHTFSCRLHGLRRYRSAIEKDPGLSQQGTEENRQTLV